MIRGNAPQSPGGARGILLKSTTQLKCEVFFDSSAQFAEVFSATGGARLIAWGTGNIG